MEIQTWGIISGRDCPIFAVKTGFGEYRIPLSLDFTENVGQHLALLPKGFDPATDEVLVVKRGAKRVWVEQWNSVVECHLSRPSYRTDKGGYWHSTDSFGEYRAEDRDDMNHRDCIEFVAVATHRPPEMVAEVESPKGDWSEYRNVVIEQYPGAVCVPGNGCMAVVVPWLRIATGETRFAAWKNAAENVATV